MRIPAHVCLLLLPLCAAAGQSVRKPVRLSFLPHGSELQKVMFPRYDEQRNLSGFLRADAMTLVDENRIAARGVDIEFYDANQAPRGRVHLPIAHVDQQKGILTADQPVRLESDRLKADGSALTYDYSSGEAFLNGPGTVEMTSNPATSMKRPVSPLSPLLSAGLCLVTANAAETPPAAATHAQGAKVTKTSVAADLEASLAAATAAKEFLSRTGTEGNAGPAPVAPPDKPLAVSEGGQSSRVTFDGGVYSDMNAGHIVFLKNVRVTDPRFELSGANDLKVFLSAGKKKEAGKDAKGAVPDFGGLGGGDVEKIVATGAVRLKQKGATNGKPPVEASGAIFTYHPKSGTITLTGGYPWVMQGANYLRARQANLTLRIEKNGDFHTSGPWDLGGKLEQKP